MIKSYLLPIIIISLLSVSIIAAQIQFTNNFISIPQGSSVNVSYTVISSNIQNQTISNLNITNNNILNIRGISVLLSNKSGSAPFSGTMRIFVSQSAYKGPYNISIEPTGAQASLFYFNIVNYTRPNNTIPPPNTTTISIPITQGLIAYQNITTPVNASTGATITLQNVTVRIKPGTYIYDYGNTYSKYNLTLYLMKPYELIFYNATYTLPYAFAIAINGNMGSGIVFVNAQNQTFPYTVIIHSLNNYTRTNGYMNGFFYQNTYQNGQMAHRLDNWTKISNNTFQNDIFYNATPKLVLYSLFPPFVPPSRNSTFLPNQSITNTIIPNQGSAPITVPQIPLQISSNNYYLVIVVLIIVIIAYIVNKKRKNK